MNTIANVSCVIFMYVFLHKENIVKRNNAERSTVDTVFYTEVNYCMRCMTTKLKLSLTKFG